MCSSIECRRIVASPRGKERPIDGDDGLSGTISSLQGPTRVGVPLTFQKPSHGAGDGVFKLFDAHEVFSTNPATDSAGRRVDVSPCEGALHRRRRAPAQRGYRALISIMNGIQMQVSSVRLQFERFIFAQVHPGSMHISGL